MAKKKETKTTAVVVKSNKVIANCDNQSYEVQNMHLKQQDIENLIYVIRGTQVMLDSDLAMIYGEETKYLKRAVRANISRFPSDFMFTLTREELNDLRCKNGTSNNRGGTRYLPYAFTEIGIAMLSSVLHSQIAVDANIRIMRAFVASRHFFAANAQMFQRIEVIEHHQLEMATHQKDTDKQIRQILKRLDDKNTTPTQGIFFDGQIFDAYTFVSDLIRSAKKSIVLFDNYVDDTVLAMLDKRKAKISATIYTKSVSKQFSLDLAKYNAQYRPIEVKQFDRVHDRFLCIDNTVYHIGASLKDLGKRWFAFSKMEMTAKELLGKM